MNDSSAWFKKKKLFRRISMSLPELEDYYREQRLYRFKQGKRLKYIRLREVLYPLFVKFLTVNRIFQKQTITILGEPKKYKEQVIYACTHIGGNDLENIYESLHRGCWWFVGDPCVLYKDVAGLLLYLNGSIFLETLDKDDRHIAYLRAIELLQRGGSLMICPEGARNGTENIPVMPLFQGTAKMALETNVKIVPVAIEQYDRHFVIEFGSELFPENYRSQTELTRELRDALATLKWDIWENEGIQTRSSFSEEYSEQFLKEFEQRIYPWDTLESVERTRFHTKVEMEQRDAFAHMEKLNPCRENAFLLRER
ncbi:MAG: lysophospholipid acyltransferase family protein [Lachnospiraceae bacterium]